MRRNIGPWIIVIVSVLCVVRGALASEGSVSFQYDQEVQLVEKNYVTAPLNLWTAPAEKSPKHPEVVTGKGLPSQAQKDATAKVCKERFDGEMESNCYYDLLGMAWTESKFDCQLIGDQGRSYGCFQIQTKLHGVSEGQAKDYESAANWTLDRLDRMGYPVYRTSAIAKHNGGGSAAEKYALKVKGKSGEFEGQGL